LRSVTRDKAALCARFGFTLFMNMIVCLIFFQVGDIEEEHYDVQSHMGALTIVGINAMFGCAQATMLSFPSERPVFLREHMSQMYGVLPYFLSKTLVEFVLLTLQVCEAWLITYWMMNFHGNFFLLAAASGLIGAASSSMGLFLGCTVADVKAAIELSPAIFVPQVMFAGFFIKIEQIPGFLRWVQYICPLKWGMNILLIAEFDNDNIPSAGKLLKSNDVEPDNLVLYVVILLVLVGLFRVVAMLLLKKKAKTLYG